MYRKKLVWHFPNFYNNQLTFASSLQKYNIKEQQFYGVQPSFVVITIRLHHFIEKDTLVTIKIEGEKSRFICQYKDEVLDYQDANPQDKLFDLLEGQSTLYYSEKLM